MILQPQNPRLGDHFLSGPLAGFSCDDTGDQRSARATLLVDAFLELADHLVDNRHAVLLAGEA